MHNDPTEFSDTPITDATHMASNTPTEPGYGNPYAHISPHYGNPYESNNPYDGSMPTFPPPPPPARFRRGPFILIISMLGLVIILVGTLLAITYSQSQKATFVPTPTVIPTAAHVATPIATPTPVVTPMQINNTPIAGNGKAPYPASQIANDFYQAGLAPRTAQVDTSWSCCNYYPEGGAADWSDLQTGITMDIATFASIDEAQIDGKNLTDEGFKAYVQNYCLLSYSGDPSNLQAYLNIMSQNCFYE